MAYTPFFEDLYLNRNKLHQFKADPMTTAERTALGQTLTAADEGVLVTDTTLDTHFWWNGTEWLPVVPPVDLGNAGQNGGNFIWNQYTAPQAANMWIAGKLRVDGTVQMGLSDTKYLSVQNWGLYHMWGTSSDYTTYGQSQTDAWFNSYNSATDSIASVKTIGSASGSYVEIGVGFPTINSTIYTTKDGIELVMTGAITGWQDKGLYILQNGDIRMNTYPSSRNDGNATTALYMDASGNLKHGPINLGNAGQNGGNFIWNTTTQQTGANINIDGGITLAGSIKFPNNGGHTINDRGDTNLNGLRFDDWLLTVNGVNRLVLSSTNGPIHISPSGDHLYLNSNTYTSGKAFIGSITDQGAYQLQVGGSIYTNVEGVALKTSSSANSMTSFAEFNTNLSSVRVGGKGSVGVGDISINGLDVYRAGAAYTYGGIVARNDLNNASLITTVGVDGYLGSFDLKVNSTILVHGEIASLGGASVSIPSLGGSGNGIVAVDNTGKLTTEPFTQPANGGNFIWNTTTQQTGANINIDGNVKGANGYFESTTGRQLNVLASGDNDVRIQLRNARQQQGFFDIAYKYESGAHRVGFTQGDYLQNSEGWVYYFEWAANNSHSYKFPGTGLFSIGGKTLVGSITDQGAYQLQVGGTAIVTGGHIKGSGNSHLYLGGDGTKLQDSNTYMQVHSTLARLVVNSSAQYFVDSSRTIISSAKTYIGAGNENTVVDQGAYNLQVGGAVHATVASGYGLNLLASAGSPVIDMTTGDGHKWRIADSWDGGGPLQFMYSYGGAALGTKVWIRPTGNIETVGGGTFAGKVFVGGITDQGAYNLQVSGNIYSNGGLIVQKNGGDLPLISNDELLTLSNSADAAFRVRSGLNRISYMIFDGYNNANAGRIYYHNDTNKMAFYTGSTERVTIDSTGQLNAKTALNVGNGGLVYNPAANGGIGQVKLSFTGVNTTANSTYPLLVLDAPLGSSEVGVSFRHANVEKGYFRVASNGQYIINAAESIFLGYGGTSDVFFGDYQPSANAGYGMFYDNSNRALGINVTGYGSVNYNLDVNGTAHVSGKTYLGNITDQGDYKLQVEGNMLVSNTVKAYNLSLTNTFSIDNASANNQTSYDGNRLLIRRRLSGGLTEVTDELAIFQRNQLDNDNACITIIAGNSNGGAAIRFGDKDLSYAGQFVYVNTPANTSDYYSWQFSGTEKLRLKSDGTLLSNGDVEITDATKGIIMKTPDGTKRFRMTIDNNGDWVKTQL